MVNEKNSKIFKIIGLVILLIIISFIAYNIVAKADFDADNIAIKNAAITAIDTGSGVFDNDGFDYSDSSSNSKIEGYIPGSDSNEKNRIVRSFDTLTYHFDFLIGSKESFNDYSERNVTIKVTLSEENAKYIAFGKDLTAGETTHTYTFDGIDSYGSFEKSITLYVLGAPNGMLIKPKFEIQESTNTDPNYIVNLGSISFDTDVYNYAYDSERSNKYNTKPTVLGFTNYMPTITSSKTAQMQFELLGQDEGQKATYNNSVGRYMTYVFGIKMNSNSSTGLKGYTMPNGEDISININASQNGSNNNLILENEWLRLYGTDKISEINPIIVNLPYSSSSSESRKRVSYPGKISLNKVSDNSYIATINNYNITYNFASISANNSTISNSDNFIGTYAISLFSPRTVADGKNDIITNFTLGNTTVKDTAGSNISISSVSLPLNNKYYEVVDYSLTGEFYDSIDSKLSDEKGKGSVSKGTEVIFKTTFNYKKTLSDQGLKEVIKVDPNAFRVIPNSDSDIKISVESSSNVKLSENDFEVSFVSGGFENSNYSASVSNNRLGSEDIQSIMTACSTVQTNLEKYSNDQIMNLYGGPCLVNNSSDIFSKIAEAQKDGKEIPITKIIVQTKKGVILPDSVKVIVDVRLRVRNVSDLTQTYQATVMATSSDYDSLLTYYSPRITNDNNSITSPNNYNKTIYAGSEVNSLDTDSPWGDSLKIVNFTSREEVTVTNKNTDGSIKVNYNVSNSETINYNIKTIIQDENEKVGADDVWYINHLKVYVNIPSSLNYIHDKKLGTPDVINNPDGSTLLMYTLPYTKPNMKIPEINFKATISPKLKGTGVAITVTSTVDAINVNGEKDASYFGHLTGSFTIYATGIQNVILSQKIGENGSVIEKNSEFSYLLSAYNNTNDSINDYEILDILPSNNDKNGSVFNGKYKVKVVLPNSLSNAKVTCSTQKYDKLLNEVNNSLNEFEDCDILNDYIEVTAIKISDIVVGANSYIDDIKVLIKPTNNEYQDKYINSFVGGSKTFSQSESNKIEARVVSRNISGRVFVDINEDGIENEGDTYLENIPVSIYALDSSNNATKVDETITNKDGYYIFKDLDVGRYKIRANYDGSIYDLTLRYATEDINHDSDAYKISDNIAEISNKRTPKESDGIRVTREIESIENMNMGLISKKTFGFDISKYITKIDLSYNNTLNTYNYDNKNKVTLSVKNSLRATARVYYGIKITNDSTQAGYIKLINESIPAGLVFDTSDEYNSQWFYSNGSVQSIALENDLINPGETRYLKIVLDMPRQEEARTFINEVSILEIQEYEPLKEAEDTNADSNSYEIGEAVTYAGIDWHVVNIDNKDNNEQILTLLANSGTINGKMSHMNSNNDIYKWSDSLINKAINGEFINNTSLNLPILYDNIICDDASGLPSASYGGTLQNEGTCLSGIYKSYKVRLLTEKEFDSIMANTDTDKSWLNVTNEFWLMNSVYQEQQYDVYGNIIKSTDASNLAKYVSASATVQTANSNLNKEVRPVITISNKNIIAE